MMKTYLLVLVVAIGAVSYIEAACEDKLDNKNKLSVTDNAGNVIYNATSCTELVKRFPGLCQGKKVGGPKGSCCVSCGPNPNCLDKLTQWAPMTVAGNVVTSCADIVSDYTVLCKKLKKKKGSCCQSCKGVDTSCVNKLVTFNVGGQKLDCDAYIATDPCLCAKKKNRKNCCASCKDVDTSACSCRDTLSASSPAKITINDAQGNPILKKDVTDCQEIVNYYAQFCKQLGGKGKQCCKSCQGVDHKCSDNLLWKANADDGTNQCNDCNCHEIMQMSPALMKDVCMNDLQGINTSLKAKKACCLQCRKV